VPYVALALQIGAAGVLTCDSDFAAARDKHLRQPRGRRAAYACPRCGR
jgi:predicted nucleic acid-binding protein